jgi:hypothetical protein
MRKKTIKIFYSWQDDIDNKLNRSFIKNCLEKTQKKINKLSQLDEADRPRLELDHDTKNVPGIPDISNTILHKIASSDIFVADLTFVAEYKNHNNRQKKISNQNVIFELGFALNSLGSQKIICVFNDAFGNPQDLLFDLQHRRFPIQYTLSKTDSSKKANVETSLINKLENAINSIITKVPLSKGKISLHNPFTINQHRDFEYIYEKLNKEVLIELEYQKNLESHEIFQMIYPEKQYCHYYCSFREALIGFIKKGNSSFNRYEFIKHIKYLLEIEDLYPPSNYYTEIQINNEDLELLLRSIDLISSSENKFLQKTYKFLHWIEFNGYKDTEVEIKGDKQEYMVNKSLMTDRRNGLS